MTVTPAQQQVIWRAVGGVVGGAFVAAALVFGALSVGTLGGLMVWAFRRVNGW